MFRLVSWKILLTILGLFALDAGVSQDFAIGGYRPIFLYLFILYSAFTWGGDQALFIALFAGILRDLSGSQTLGVETVSVVFWAIVLDSILLKISRDSQGVKFILPFFYVFSVLLLNLGFSTFLNQKDAMIVFEGIPKAFFTALYTAIVLPVMSGLFGVWFQPQKRTRQYELFSK